MTEFLGSAIAFIAMFVIAGLVLWLRDRVRDRPLSSEEIERRRQEYERRLADPHWSFIASEFGGSVPFAVDSLYRNSSLIHSADLTPRSGPEVAWFVPADDNAFDSEQWFNPPSDAFVFAVTRFGDPFFVRTSEVELGLPVYVLYHDGGDVEKIESSLDQFVSGLRPAPSA